LSSTDCTVINVALIVTSLLVSTEIN